MVWLRLILRSNCSHGTLGEAQALKGLPDMMVEGLRPPSYALASLDPLAGEHRAQRVVGLGVVGFEGRAPAPDAAGRRRRLVGHDARQAEVQVVGGIGRDERDGP